MAKQLPLKAKQGRNDYEAMKQVARDVGKYEDAKDVAREARGSAHVRKEDLQEVLTDAQIEKAVGRSGTAIEKTTGFLEDTEDGAIFTAWHYGHAR